MSGLSIEFERAACRLFLIRGWIGWDDPRYGCIALAEGAQSVRFGSHREPGVNLVPVPFSFFGPGVLEPERWSCQVEDVPNGRNKAAPADATNIDKGLTVNLVQEGIGL